MSTDYSKMSDLEININVAELLHPGKKFTAAYSFFQSEGPAVQWICGYAEYIKADYCNNPADAWPIIVKNRISIDFDSDGSGELREEWVTASNQYFSGYLTCEKALRAAMIVFLMMQESKNAS